MGEPPPKKPARKPRQPSSFRQRDVAAAIKAAKTSGLAISHVEVDPKTARITLTVKADDGTETRNPFDSAPTKDPALRRRKTKTS
jgi:hypothetical protein